MTSDERLSRPTKVLILVVVSLSLFMALLDVTVVGVALPSIRQRLSASFDQVQWVINAYTLALAALLVTLGKIGDLVGHRRLFTIGVGLFSAGSAAAALSSAAFWGGLPGIEVLIASRVLQGIGAAAMLPSTSAIIAGTFYGRERSIAYGVYGGITALATALGPVVGGVLVDRIGWEAIFSLNVPIGVLAVVLALVVVPRKGSATNDRRIDLPGLLTFTAFCLCLILALIRGNDVAGGWGSAQIVALFCASAVALALFIVVELRASRPMIKLQLFANPRFSGSAVSAFALSAGLYALLFFLSIYFQNFLGYSALATGYRLLAFSGVIVVAAPLAGMLASRVGHRPVMTTGLLAMTLGVFAMTLVSSSPAQAAWLALLPSLLVAGFGSGLVNPGISEIAVNSAPPPDSGMASAVSSVVRQFGIAVGVALFGALLRSKYDSELTNQLASITVNPGQSGNALPAIEHGIRAAGVFAGSTGLAQMPAQFAAIAHTPLFDALQTAAREAFMAGLRLLFIVGGSLLAVGSLLAFLLLAGSRAESRAQATEVRE